MASKREYDKARIEGNRERSRSSERSKRIIAKVDKNRESNKRVKDRWSKGK